MSQKTENRRAALRERLLEAAEIRMARDGVETLRARDLAQDAGCSVGAIYNVFEDLTALAMAVNARTFLKIGQGVAEVSDPDLPPAEHLTRLAHAYLGFARQNTGLWRALFDLNTRTDDDIPSWYTNALDTLFDHIRAPVAQLFPTEDAAGVDLMTRTLFSAIHGVISLGLAQRISAVPDDRIEEMIAKLLRSVSEKS